MNDARMRALTAWHPIKLTSHSCPSARQLNPGSTSVRRVAHTKKRCGILIFVSLAEHYARIIADEGIAQKVPNAEWQAAIDALISHMRTGEIAAGFIAAIARCGSLLAAHAPSDGSANELPDRLYVM
jgi:putative membrane protein